jgi:hypothetical protein
VHVKIFSLFAVLVAAAVAVGGSGAVTAKERGIAKIDVSTTSGVIHYLRSIHVSTRRVVIQRGLRNYAGAHCPGKGWTCARTRHTVVQIAKPGGLNRFACRTAKCAVVQFGGASRGLRLLAAAQASSALTPPVNTASCVKTTGITQSCVINQPNATGTNKAVVWMVTPKLTGLTQSATYSASITQGPLSAGGSSNDNLACVTQGVTIDGSTIKATAGSVTVTNDAHQSIFIQQNSLQGDNTVQGAVKGGTQKNPTYDCNPDATQPLTQAETLTSTVTGKGSITQKQDTATTGSANVVVDIEQNQDINGFQGFFGAASGLNNAAFEQSSNQQAIANTPKGPVVQTQSADVPNPPYSGIVGTINQDSSNTSTAHATQKETQCEDAVNVPTTPATCDTDHLDTVPSYSITQKQYGPLGVFTPPARHSGRVPFAHKGYGQSQQTGNTGDKFFLTQTSKQDNDGGPHSTQKNIIVGDCTSGTDSGCQAGQTATLNGLGINDGYTSPTITGLTINCSNGNGTCTATPPPAPEITGTPDDPSESTSATFTWTEAATAGVTLKCSIDGGTTFTNCDSPTSTSYSNLSLGSHTFVVKAVDNTPSHNESDTDSFTWTIVPYLTFEATDDGASAGWSGNVPGSSIDLTVGSDAPNTFAQFTLHNFEGIAIGDLPAEPTFTTDTFSGGSPRYEIDLDNGDYLFGYPSNAPFGRSWDVNCGHVGCVPMAQVPWGDVQTAEGTAKVTDVLVEADGGQSDGTTDVITDFNFDGYDLSFFGNHFH